MPDAFLHIFGSGGVAIGLDEGRTVRVGRRTGEVILDDPLVSGLHCSFSLIDGSIVIEDLGSTNGTRVDGRLIDAREILAPDATVLIGTHRITLRPSWDLRDGEYAEEEVTMMLQPEQHLAVEQLEMLRLRAEVADMRNAIVKTDGKLSDLADKLHAARENEHRIRLTGEKLRLQVTVERILRAALTAPDLLDRMLETLLHWSGIELAPRALGFVYSGEGRLEAAAMRGSFTDAELADLRTRSEAVLSGSAILDVGRYFIPLRAGRTVEGMLVLHARSASVEPWLDLIRALGVQAAGALQRLRMDAENRRITRDLEIARDLALRASRAQSAFLANMSHELRTPLNAILGYAEMLQEELSVEGCLGDQAEQDLDRIRSAAGHLLSLVGGVLDHSDLLTGTLQVRASEIDVRDLVERAAALVEPLLVKHRDQLDLILGDGLGTMRSDAEKVQRIVLTLLTNACRFTEDGRIELEAERELRPEGDWVRLVVRDTGVGMTAEELDVIFEPFTQVDGSTTRLRDGIGLGLTLAKEYCALLGGEIDVQSEPGAGSCFTVRLPVVVPAR